MPASKISLDKAKNNKLFYFVANAVVYREKDGRCLILKRHAREATHPNKYCVPGGKLEWGDLDITKPSRMNGEVIDFEDAIEELLAREVKEEAGIDVEGPMRFINDVAYIRPDGVPTVLVKFVMKYAGGDVVLEEGGFDGYAWVNAEEVGDYDCIDGIAEEISKAIQLFSKQPA